MMYRESAVFSSRISAISAGGSGKSSGTNVGSARGGGSSPFSTEYSSASTSENVNGRLSRPVGIGTTSLWNHLLAQELHDLRHQPLHAPLRGEPQERPIAVRWQFELGRDHGQVLTDLLPCSESLPFLGAGVRHQLGERVGLL